MGDVFESVFDVVDSLMGGGGESSPTVNIPAPLDMTPFYTQMAQQQESLQTTMAQQQEAFQTTLMEQSAAADKRLADATAAQTALLKPTKMPSPTSSDVRGAKRKAVAGLRARKGRDSTILSDTDTLGG